MELTTIVLWISSFAWVIVICTGTSTLSLPNSANCGDQAVLVCTSTDWSCYAYKFIKEGVTIYNQVGPQDVADKARYSATVTSANQAQLTITNIQLSDAVAYTCNCGYDVTSANQTLRYECKAVSSTAAITSNKKLTITMDRLYPQPTNIVTSLINPAIKVPGTYICGPSLTLASHFTCTWNSITSLTDGYNGYTITVTTLTQAAPVSGSFRIVTPKSPTISNLSTISNNREIILGVQDTPLTIQCVSRGGIPAPTLAWYRGSTNTTSLAQSSTSDFVQQSDGTYTVTLIHRFTPDRRDDMMLFLCRVFYPGATTGALADPSPASALLFLDLKPYTPTVSQTGETASGGTMTLQCTSTNGRPAPSITWFYLNQTLTPSYTSIIDQTSQTYTVVSVLQRSVSAVDNGQTATCRVFHTLLSLPLNSTINVDVKFGPTSGSVTISGNKATPATGTNKIQLNCTSGSSNPASNITWYNGSDIIPNTEGYTRWHGNNRGVKSSNILTITPSRYMDGDRITCGTNNGYGSVNTYVDLDILYSCLIQTLQNVTAIEGEPDITLTCSASSKPPANFTWDKGNVVLANGIGSLTSNKLMYVIPRVDRTDAGSYRCRAGNSVGSPDSKDAYLIVKYPPTVTMSVTTSPSYTVTCTAEGYPDSYKYQDWVQIWPGYGPVATIPFNLASMTLPNDTYERSGVYVCGASNGIAVYGTDQLYMHGNETVLIPAPPVLLEPKSDVERFRVAGRLGQDASTKIKYWSNVKDSVVRCYELVGDTQSSSSVCNVMMTETEVQLPVFNHVVTETGTLATIKIPIKSVEYLTDYDIVVTNRNGKSVLGITIVPEGPPAAPTVADIAVTPGQVLLTLVPGFHGGYNQTLVVQISTDLTTWINKTSVYIGLDNRPTEVQLVDLKGNALHYVLIFSYNKVGRSNSSSEILNFTATEDASLVTPPTAAWIGGTAGSTCALVVVAVIVVVVLRNRKAGLVFSKTGDKRCLTHEPANTDGVVECAMYVSAGNVQPGPSIRDEYSTPQKKGHAVQTDNVYSVVSKQKKDLYATPMKENVGNKRGKAGKPVKGTRHVPQVSETEFGRQETSNQRQIPKKFVNDDGLIYADLEFDSTANYDVIHGLDDITIYEEIDFTKTAEPLPESDDESNDKKFKKNVKTTI